MTEITFECPECDGRVAAEESMIGETVGCPHCSKSIQIPSPEPSEQQGLIASPQPESVLQRLDRYHTNEDRGRLGSAASAVVKWVAKSVASSVAKKMAPPVYEPLSGEAIEAFTVAVRRGDTSGNYVVLCLILCLVFGAIEVGAGNVLAANDYLFFTILAILGILNFYVVYRTRKSYLAVMEETTAHFIDLYEVHLGHTDYAKRFLRDVRKDRFGAAKSGFALSFFTGDWWLALIGGATSAYGLASSAIKDSGKPEVQKALEDEIRRGVRCLLINRWSIGTFWAGMLLLTIASITFAVVNGRETYLEAKTERAQDIEPAERAKDHLALSKNGPLV